MRVDLAGQNQNGKMDFGKDNVEYLKILGDFVDKNKNVVGCLNLCFFP